MFSGITANNAVQLYKDFSAALPDAKLYGPDGVAESGVRRPQGGRHPGRRGVQGEGAPSRPCRPTSTRRRARSSSRSSSEKYGEDNPDPYAIYGYEAMRLALDAIERSGTGSKEDVLDGAVRRRRTVTSVLGTYSIDENGDTTLTDYGVYTIEGGELTFDQTIKAADRLI